MGYRHWQSTTVEGTKQFTKADRRRKKDPIVKFIWIHQKKTRRICLYDVWAWAALRLLFPMLSSQSVASFSFRVQFEFDNERKWTVFGDFRFIQSMEKAKNCVNGIKLCKKKIKKIRKCSPQNSFYFSIKRKLVFRSGAYHQKVLELPKFHQRSWLVTVVWVCMVKFTLTWSLLLLTIIYIGNNSIGEFLYVFTLGHGSTNDWLWNRIV